MCEGAWMRLRGIPSTSLGWQSWPERLARLLGYLFWLFKYLMKINAPTSSDSEQDLQLNPLNHSLEETIVRASGVGRQLEETINFCGIHIKIPISETLTVCYWHCGSLSKPAQEKDKAAAIRSIRGRNKTPYNVVFQSNHFDHR